MLLHATEFQARHDTPVVGGGAQQICGIELRFTKECIKTLVLKADDLAHDRPDGCGGKPAQRLQLSRTLTTGDELDHAP